MSDTQTQSNFAGFIALPGKTFRAGFDAPTGADWKELDAAFMAALASQYPRLVDLYHDMAKAGAHIKAWLGPSELLQSLQDQDFEHNILAVGEYA